MMKTIMRIMAMMTMMITVTAVMMMTQGNLEQGHSASQAKADTAGICITKAMNRPLAAL